MDGTLKRLLDQEANLSQIAERLSVVTGLPDATRAAQGLFASSGAINSIAEEARRHHDLIRSLVGPLSEMRHLHLFDEQSRLYQDLRHTQELLALNSGLNDEMKFAKALISDYEAAYRLPTSSEMSRLIAEITRGGIPTALERLAEEESSLKRAMEAMQTPWLRVNASFQSMTSFAELQGIGLAISKMPAFDNSLAESLRLNLGDWRERITWPEEIFGDITARSEFYAERGFNRDLTDFPAEAFRQGLGIAGLGTGSSDLVRLYGPPVPAAHKDEETVLTRTNTAHDWLQRLENRLREFIDQAMTAAFGADWPKHRLPNGLYEKWTEKKQASEKKSEAKWPVIFYADFTDYELVICKRDNWREVFAARFERPESVRESLQRLYPIRMCTMHARAITQDDELFLYVEARRLVKALK